MKRIILHIGSPKTGTSIIQSHLAQNREVLRDNGFLYPITISSNPKLYRTYESSHLLMYSLAGWEQFTEFSPEAFFERANATAAEHDIETMLLSAENTYWLPKQITAREKPEEQEYWDEKSAYVGRIAKAFEGYEVKIVLYLRRQDRWIESWYNQQIKNGNHLPLEMLSFVDHHHYLLDYSRMLETWAGHFGRDNIVVRAYEKEQLPNGLFADFAEAVGLGDPGQYPLREAARYNAQLDRDALEFLNLCNGIEMDNDERYWLRILIRKITNQFESKKVFTQQGFLSPTERCEVLQKYAAINQSVADDYMGRNGDPLFLEAEPDESDDWQPYPGLPVEVATRLMMEIMLDIRKNAAASAEKKNSTDNDKAEEHIVDPEQRAREDLKFWQQQCWAYKAP